MVTGGREIDVTPQLTGAETDAVVQLVLSPWVEAVTVTGGRYDSDYHYVVLDMTADPQVTVRVRTGAPAGADVSVRGVVLTADGTVRDEMTLRWRVAGVERVADGTWQTYDRDGACVQLRPAVSDGAAYDWYGVCRQSDAEPADCQQRWANLMGYGSCEDETQARFEVGKCVEVTVGSASVAMWSQGEGWSDGGVLHPAESLVQRVRGTVTMESLPTGVQHAEVRVYGGSRGAGALRLSRPEVLSGGWEWIWTDEYWRKELSVEQLSAERLTFELLTMQDWLVGADAAGKLDLENKIGLVLTLTDGTQQSWPLAVRGAQTNVCADSPVVQTPVTLRGAEISVAGAVVDTGAVTDEPLLEGLLTDVEQLRTGRGTQTETVMGLTVRPVLTAPGVYWATADEPLTLGGEYFLPEGVTLVLEAPQVWVDSDFTLRGAPAGLVVLGGLVVDEHVSQLEGVWVVANPQTGVAGPVYGSGPTGLPLTVTGVLQGDSRDLVASRQTVGTRSAVVPSVNVVPDVRLYTQGVPLLEQFTGGNRRAE